MPTWTIKGGARASGRDLSWETSVYGNAEQWVQPVLTAGQSAVSWTRSGDTAGTAVMSAGHAILNADLVDVYWASGVHYGATATVTINSVALSGGSGDNFPASDTAVMLCSQVAVSLAVVGDNVAALVGAATYRSLVCLLDSGGTPAAAKAFEILPTAGLSWCEASGLPNPLDSFTVASATISTTDPTSELTEKPVTLGVLYDSTPSYPG